MRYRSVVPFIVAVIMLLASPFARAVEVTKEDWIAAMKTALPAAFCKSGQMFRECFKVSPVECEETALSVTRICIEDLKSKMPDKLNQPKDGQYWGTQLGICAGNAYEATLSKKKINSKKCNDPSAWQ